MIERKIMGSGCTRIATRNVVLPQETASTISVASTKEKVRKIPPSPVNPRNEAKRIKPARLTVNSHKATSVNSINSETREESLKHYDGQANLLDIKTQKRKSETDDPFESDAGSKVDDRPPLPPAAQRRYKRQPTIENAVCFQEDDQINHYQIQEEIGRGSFATVYRCHSKKHEDSYAMKVISKKRLIRKVGLMPRNPKKRSNPLDALHREIAILKKVDHPNVVKLIEVIDDPEIDNVYLIFELVERGPAQDIPTEHPMSETTARSYFRDAVLGLEYLHYTKIIHRDIKPTNLLLDKNDHIKIADFGVSDIFEGEDDTMNRFAGSPAFQAPEAIADGRVKFSGKAADIWAMGVTLYSFVYGKCPFYDNDLTILYDKIRNECLQFPEMPLVDPQLQDLISRLLAKIPEERIKMQEIKEHPWLTRGGRDPMPKTEEHCVAIEISDDDIRNSVTLISKLSSLVLVKTILRKRTFSSSRRKDKHNLRSNSTPDISQSQNTYLDMQRRVSKSAASLYSRKIR